MSFPACSPKLRYRRHTVVRKNRDFRIVRGPESPREHVQSAVPGSCESDGAASLRTDRRPTRTVSMDAKNGLES